MQTNMQNSNHWMLTLLLLTILSTNSQAQWSQSATAIFPTVLNRNIGINTSTPNTKLHINGTGIENNGTTAVMRIVSGNGSQNLLLDGNEIDAMADGLFLNNNTSQNVSIVTGGGNVGINTSAPNTKLHVNGGNIENNGVTAVMRIVSANGAQNLLLDGNEIDALADGLFLNNNTNQRVILATGGGNVGIGTSNPTHKLSVNGTIQSKEIRVETGWADYVFAPGYTLRPLCEVESFVQENKHLPGIPSAAEIQQNGLAVGEVQTKMMEKIEELTLYLIELNKQNEALRLRLESLEKQ